MGAPRSYFQLILSKSPPKGSSAQETDSFSNKNKGRRPFNSRINRGPTQPLEDPRALLLKEITIISTNRIINYTTVGSRVNLILLVDDNSLPLIIEVNMRG